MQSPRKISPIAWPDDAQSRPAPIVRQLYPVESDPRLAEDDPPSDRRSGVRRVALPSAEVDEVVADLTWDPRREA
jgi:hypothetical protein